MKNLLNSIAEIPIITPILVIAFVCLLKWIMQGGRYRKETSTSGKVIIITGADSGIGLETTRELAKRGGIVYMACVEMEKCLKMRQVIISETGNKQVHALKLDLASLASVREFVKNFKKIENRLDILINNAGVMGCPYKYTEDGFEMQMGVNHMGHFLLTNLLLDLLKKSAPSRIVVVSSLAHTWGKINIDDFNSEKSYDPLKNYGNSKLANLLFIRELASRLEGTKVTANALHPGVVSTAIVRDFGGSLSSVYSFSYKLIFWPLLKTAKSGAQTTIYAALDPDLETVTGNYFADCKQKKIAKAATDDRMAKWLWTKSEKCTMLKCD